MGAQLARMPGGFVRTYEGVYHKTGPDWIRTGAVLCGRDVTRYAYTAPTLEAVRRTQRELCRDCAARLDVEGGACSCADLDPRARQGGAACPVCQP